MVEADIPAALALWQGLPGIGLRNADRPEALARYLHRNPGCSFVASGEDGEIVGVSLCGHDGRRGYMHHAAVLPAYRRRGIGRRLVEHCLAALRNEGIEKVQIWVFAANTDGQEFWKRLGWRERDELLLMSVVTGDDPNA
jgi:ribosomal protein S18 acetylase RimI-like enzyme